MIMKYRVFALMGVLALTAGTVLAQDYDDIYYDASKSVSGKTKETKVDKKSKTVVVYGEVPDEYKVAAQENYRVERDEDEYNRRGAFEPTFEVDINGDTIYDLEDEAFANTRRIERFYNPDVVILSDDDDLVELYYDESPTINLVVGTDMGYAASYGWTTSYYPWYTGWYDPWSLAYYSPWYAGWHDPWYVGWYSPWYSHWHGPSLWGWTYWGARPWYGHHYYGWTPWYDNVRYWSGGSHGYRHDNNGWRGNHGRVGLASNRNPNGRTTREGINRHYNGTDVTRSGGRVGNRDGYAGNRGGGNVTTRGGGNVTTRGTGGTVSRGSGNVATPKSGNRTSSSGYYNGGTRSANAGTRSYSGSSSSGSRSYSGSSSSGSRSYSGSSSSGSRSYSGSSSGGSRSYSSGSSGGSHSSSGGSSGGGGRRR